MADFLTVNGIRLDLKLLKGALKDPKISPERSPELPTFRAAPETASPTLGPAP